MVELNVVHKAAGESMANLVIIASQQWQEDYHRLHDSFADFAAYYKFYREAVESIPRTEIYVTEDGGLIGALILSPDMDFHHGAVLAPVVCYMLPARRGVYGCAKQIRSAMVETCAYYGLHKYQTMKHISDSAYTLTTHTGHYIDI